MAGEGCAVQHNANGTAIDRIRIIEIRKDKQIFPTVLPTLNSGHIAKGSMHPFCTYLHWKWRKNPSVGTGELWESIYVESTDT